MEIDWKMNHLRDAETDNDGWQPAERAHTDTAHAMPQWHMQN